MTRHSFTQTAAKTFHPVLWGICLLIVIPFFTPRPMLAFIPIIAITLLMIFGKWPRAGIYAIVALIPFGNYRQIGEFAGGVKIHWLIAFMLLFIFGMRMLVKKRAPEQLHSGLWPLYAVFLTISLIAAIASPFPEVAMKNLSLLGVGALFVFLVMAFMDRKGVTEILPLVIVISVGISAGLAAIGYFFDIPLFADKVGGSFKRGIGTAPDPNNLSLMIVFSLPFLMHWFFTTPKKTHRLIALGILLGDVLGLVSTYSRGGALMFVLAGFAILYYHRHRLSPRNIGLNAGILGFLLITILLLIPASYWDRQKSLVADDTDFSLNRRFSYLIVARDSFIKRPILGWGPGAYPTLYAQSESAARFTRPGRSNYRPAHNTYLEALIGMGIPGFLSFISLLVLTFMNYTKARKTALDQKNNPFAEWAGTYRLAFVLLLLYLVIFSDIFHKYLLLSLALSPLILFHANHVVRHARHEIKHEIFGETKEETIGLSP